MWSSPAASSDYNHHTCHAPYAACWDFPHTVGDTSWQLADDNSWQLEVSSNGSVRESWLPLLSWLKDKEDRTEHEVECDN